MKKRDKIWLFIMIILMIWDIILHFTSYTDNTFGLHINYIASILMAFTIGISYSEYIMS